MTITQLVALIKKQNPEWVDQDILDLLNWFQEMCLKTSSAENIYYDITTGDLPFLSTTQGVFQYIMPSLYYDVEAIVIKDHTLLTNNPAFTASHFGEFKYPSDLIRLGSHNYTQVPTVKTKAFGPAGVCSIMFTFDPQTTTNTYQIYGYTFQNAITSKQSILYIPDKYHLSCVVPAIQTLIDGLDNGDFENSIAKINQLYLPPIWGDRVYNSMSNFSTRPMGI